MLNNPCISGVKPSCRGRQIFLMCCWIWLASVNVLNSNKKICNYKVQVSIFFLIVHEFCVLSHKSWPVQNPQNFLLCLLWKVCKVLYLIYLLLFSTAQFYRYKNSPLSLPIFPSHISSCIITVVYSLSNVSNSTFCYSGVSWHSRYRQRLKNLLSYTLGIFISLEALFLYISYMTLL